MGKNVKIKLKLSTHLPPQQAVRMCAEVTLLHPAMALAFNPVMGSKQANRKWYKVTYIL